MVCEQCRIIKKALVMKKSELVNQGMFLDSLDDDSQNNVVMMDACAFMVSQIDEVLSCFQEGKVIDRTEEEQNEDGRKGNVVEEGIEDGESGADATEEDRQSRSVGREEDEESTSAHGQDNELAHERNEEDSDEVSVHGNDGTGKKQKDSRKETERAHEPVGEDADDEAQERDSEKEEGRTKRVGSGSDKQELEGMVEITKTCTRCGDDFVIYQEKGKKKGRPRYRCFNCSPVHESKDEEE